MNKNSLKKVKNEDLTLRAVNGIKNLLFSNEITPAFRLNARDLSKRLGMSPTPVTQALKLLFFQGILGHVPNRGYFLETNTPEMIQDIFNLRIALEIAGLDTIPARISPADWQNLEKALSDHLNALKKGSAKRILLADMAFHTTLARISTGTAGERLMRNLFEMLYLKNRGVILYISPRQQFGSHHRELLDFLKKNDIVSARVSLTRHLESVRDAVLEGMASQDEEDLHLDW